MRKTCPLAARSSSSVVNVRRANANALITGLKPVCGGLTGSSEGAWVTPAAMRLDKTEWASMVGGGFGMQCSVDVGGYFRKERWLPWLIYVFLQMRGCPHPLHAAICSLCPNYMSATGP